MSEGHRVWIKVQVPESLHRKLKSEAPILGLTLERYVEKILMERRQPK